MEVTERKRDLGIPFVGCCHNASPVHFLTAKASMRSTADVPGFCQKIANNEPRVEALFGEITGTGVL